MNKVIVSVSNDIFTDQRVEKVCNTLQNNGFEVTIIGRKLKNSKPIERKYKTRRIKLLFNKSFMFYLELNLRLFFILFFSKKDILLSNDLDTLLPNYLISIFQKKKIIYDSHELFTEVPELVYRPFTKKIWCNIEAFILPKLKNTYTVCNSIADYYNKKYGTNFKTIMNMPSKKKIELGQFSFDTKGKKIILYQGVLNVGRGLELIIETIRFLEDSILVIAGFGIYFKKLKAKVEELNLENKVHFLGKLSPKRLHKITPLANLGISLEEDVGLNYKYALPNKVFDYIQAEIPILVSDLKEMRKIVEKHKVGELVKSRTPVKLANQIELLLKKDFSSGLKIAKKELIWENQEEKLLEIFQ